MASGESSVKCLRNVIVTAVTFDQWLFAQWDVTTGWPQVTTGTRGHGEQYTWSNNWLPLKVIVALMHFFFYFRYVVSDMLFQINCDVKSEMCDWFIVTPEPEPGSELRRHCDRRYWSHAAIAEWKFTLDIFWFWRLRLIDCPWPRVLRHEGHGAQPHPGRGRDSAPAQSPSFSSSRFILTLQKWDLTWSWLIKSVVL